MLIEANSPSAEAITTKMSVVTNFIDTTSKLHSTENNVLQRLAHLGKLSGALGIIASIFTITVESIGARRHKQVMAEFAKVNAGIRQVQEDVKFLDKRIVLEHIRTRLFPLFEILRKGLLHLNNNDQSRLRETCLPSICLDALETVVFHSPDLVKAFYESAEVNGDLEMVATFIDKLIGFVGNSMIMVQGLHSKNITEEVKAKAMKEAFEDSIKLCKEDLPRILPRIKVIAEKAMNNSDSHKEVLEAMKSQLDSKFYWLHLGYLVYDDIGSDKDHYLTGYLLPILHINDHNTVIIFRPKSDIVTERITVMPRSAEAYKEGKAGTVEQCQTYARNCCPGDVKKFYATATIKWSAHLKQSIPLELHAYRGHSPQWVEGYLNPGHINPNVITLKSISP